MRKVREEAIRQLLVQVAELRSYIYYELESTIQAADLRARRLEDALRHALGEQPRIHKCTHWCEIHEPLVR